MYGGTGNVAQRRRNRQKRQASGAPGRIRTTNKRSGISRDIHFTTEADTGNIITFLPKLSNKKARMTQGHPGRRAVLQKSKATFSLTCFYAVARAESSPKATLPSLFRRQADSQFWTFRHMSRILVRKPERYSGATREIVLFKDILWLFAFLQLAILQLACAVLQPRQPFRLRFGLVPIDYCWYNRESWLLSWLALNRSKNCMWRCYSLSLLLSISTKQAII